MSWDGWTEVNLEDSPWERERLEADARDWENEKARDREITLEDDTLRIKDKA